MCDSQDEIDRYSSKLCDRGKESVCGWLKDRYGLSWQVVPAELAHMLTDADRGRAERVLTAVMKMKKLDVAALKRAYAGME